MSIITVLSINAYSMAMRNIKMNNLKSDIIMFSNHLERLSFGKNTNAHFRGKTFEDIFVNTGLVKDNVTPFGGNQVAYDVFTEMCEDCSWDSLRK